MASHLCSETQEQSVFLNANNEQAACLAENAHDERPAVERGASKI
jgi:hypothetical protein